MSQLQAKVLHGEERLGRVRMKVLVCICDGHIKKKVEFHIKLSSAEIVASELVSSILVVMDNVVGAGHKHSCSIFLSPKDST